jgi:putative flippase GtrA
MLGTQYILKLPLTPVPTFIQRFARLGRFGVVSGFGLALDFCISIALREAGLPVFFANVVGAACAVTFVFFASIRRVFDADPTPAQRSRKYVAYLTWQAVAVPAASTAIAALTPLGERAAHAIADALPALAPLASRPGAPFFLAKCAVTPATFYANFLFMNWLLTGRLRWH